MTDIDITDLPATVRTYLTAHTARDTAAALAAYTDDAVVTDDGHTYRGTEELRGWLERSSAEYTFTTELTGPSASTTGSGSRPATWRATSPAGSSTCSTGSPCAATASPS